MEISEKMKICFNDELMENKILTENEKKVLASLMYSYQICKQAKDNIIIRAMSDLRKDIKISNNDMYDAIRNLESLYHMVERTAGESRGKEKSSIASQFKLNFEAILNPPKEPVKFDFSKMKKSSETSINTVDIDTDLDTDIDIITDIDKDNNTSTNINNNIDIEIDKSVVFENEINSEKDDYSIELDNYLVRNTIQTYDDIQVKSQLNEMIYNIKQIDDTKQLLPTIDAIYHFITEHKDKFKSWRVFDLKTKIQDVISIRFKELESKKKTHQPA